LILNYDYLHAQIDISEDSTILKAKGHGIVTFEGNGEKIILSGDGILFVNENSDVNLLTSDGEEIPIEESTCIPTEEGGCLYIIGINESGINDGIDARAQIEGEDIKVDFTGANIALQASGNGKVILKGYGIYRLGKIVGRWFPDGTTINLKP
jgi:hypothetical protein